MKQKTWVLGIAAVLVAVCVTGMAVTTSAKPASPAALGAPVRTATVEKAKLSAVVSEDGALTYQAGPDGSPYSVINQAQGTYTEAARSPCAP